MITSAPTTPTSKPPNGRTPPLQNGDRLTAAEFERRYEQMPDVKKAELIDGVVYMPSPVKHENHGRPHILIATWLGTYMSETPGVDGGDDYVRLETADGAFRSEVFSGLWLDAQALIAGDIRKVLDVLRIGMTSR